MAAPPLLANELTQEHGRDLLRLERDELKRLLPLYRDAREKILGRLMAVDAETFTAQHLRVVRVQIDRGIREMVAALKVRQDDLAEDLLEDGIRQTLAEIAVHDRIFRGAATGRIQLAALRKIAAPKALLLDRHASSLNAYGANLIADIQGRLGLHLVQRSSWRDMAIDVAGRLHSHGITGARWKAERIVRTELVDALNAGHQAALEASADLLPGLLRQWDSTLDERTSDVCRTLNGQIRPLDKPWVWKDRAIARPPAIPNCRSRIIPFHQEWADLDEQISPQQVAQAKAMAGPKKRAPKPVTKAEAKANLAKAEEAYLAQIAAGQSPTLDPVRKAALVFLGKDLSGDALATSVSQRLAFVAEQGKAALLKARQGAQAALEAVEKSWLESYVAAGGKVVSRDLTSELKAAATALGQLDGDADLVAKRLAAVTKQGDEIVGARVAQAQAQVEAAKANVIAEHGKPGPPNWKPLGAAASDLGKAKGLAGQDLDDFIFAISKEAADAGEVFRKGKLSDLQAVADSAFAKFAQNIGKATAWSDDLQKLGTATEKAFHDLHALKGSSGKALAEAVAKDVKKAMVAGRGQAVERAHLKAKDVVELLVSGKQPAKLEDEYLAIRRWVAELHGEKNPDAVAKAAYEGLKQQAAEQIKQAALQAEADALKPWVAKLYDDDAAVNVTAARHLLDAKDPEALQIAAKAHLAEADAASAVKAKATQILGKHLEDSLGTYKQLLYDGLTEPAAGFEGYLKAIATSLGKSKSAQTKLLKKVQKEVADQKAAAAVPKAAASPTWSKTTQSGAPKTITLPNGKTAKQVGGSSGSNPGGFYRTADGEEVFAKFPKSVGQVGAEDTSAELARLMGLQTKDYTTFETGDHVAIASRKLKFHEPGAAALAKKPTEDLVDHFVHAAWTRNWDVVGVDYANLVEIPGGGLLGMDYGGSLLWRAQGALKPGGMPKVVEELKTLRSTNAQAAKVFKKLTDQDVAQAIQAKLAPLDEEQILAAVARGKFSDADRKVIQKGLLERKEWLEEWADKVLGTSATGTPKEALEAHLAAVRNAGGLKTKSGKSVPDYQTERLQKALDGDATAAAKLGRALWTGTDELEADRELSLRLLLAAWNKDSGPVTQQLEQFSETMGDVLSVLKQKGTGALSTKPLVNDLAKLEAKRAAEKAAAEAAAKEAAEKAAREFAERNKDILAKKAAYEKELAAYKPKLEAWQDKVQKITGTKYTKTGALSASYKKKLGKWAQDLKAAKYDGEVRARARDALTSYQRTVGEADAYIADLKRQIAALDAKKKTEGYLRYSDRYTLQSLRRDLRNRNKQKKDALAAFQVEIEKLIDEAGILPPRPQPPKPPPGLGGAKRPPSFQPGHPSWTARTAEFQRIGVELGMSPSEISRQKDGIESAIRTWKGSAAGIRQAQALKHKGKLDEFRSHGYRAQAEAFESPLWENATGHEGDLWRGERFADNSGQAGGRSAAQNREWLKRFLEQNVGGEWEWPYSAGFSTNNGFRGSGYGGNMPIQYHIRGRSSARSFQNFGGYTGEAELQTKRGAKFRIESYQWLERPNQHGHQVHINLVEVFEDGTTGLD